MTAPAESRPGFLADVIVELALASREQVDEARNYAKLEGRTLSEVLIERGTLGEQELAQAVAARYGLPLIDLKSFPIDPDAAQLVGRYTARRYGVAPAGFAADGALLLAMPDPTDSLARSDVAVSTRLEVRPVIAPRSQIDALIETLPERRTIGPVLGDDPSAIPRSGPTMWQSEKTVSDRYGGEGSGPDPSDSPALRGVDRFAEKDSKGRPLRTSDADTRISRLCDQLSDRDSQLARLRDEVSGLEAALAERDARLAELEGSAKHRDRALADMGKQLAEAASSNGSA